VKVPIVGFGDEAGRTYPGSAFLKADQSSKCDPPPEMAKGNDTKAEAVGLPPLAATFILAYMVRGGRRRLWAKR
jgi:hypothetical protein